MPWPKKGRCAKHLPHTLSICVTTVEELCFGTPWYLCSTTPPWALPFALYVLPWFNLQKSTTSHFSELNFTFQSLPHFPSWSRSYCNLRQHSSLPTSPLDLVLSTKLLIMPPIFSYNLFCFRVRLKVMRCAGILQGEQLRHQMSSPSTVKLTLWACRRQWTTSLLCKPGVSCLMYLTQGSDVGVPQLQRGAELLWLSSMFWAGWCQAPQCGAEVPCMVYLQYVDEMIHISAHTQLSQATRLWAVLYRY